MGFGAERANLMGETVQMPYDESGAGGPSLNNQYEESKASGGGGGYLNTRATNAKTQLIQEIMAFNSES